MQNVQERIREESLSTFGKRQIGVDVLLMISVKKSCLSFDIKCYYYSFKRAII